MAKSALELEREARIAANKARLAEIGLVQTVQAIASVQTEQARVRRAAKAASRAARKAAGTAPAGRVRRSERVAGLDAPNYNENDRLLARADPEGGSRDRRLMRENVTEEIYGVSHLDALGSHQQEWELFVDGYDANGNRIYDKVNGQTCHQCRQKTLGKRTCCSGCESLTGVFCGDCLFMRYGEHVDEANANPDWRCPMCRDLCNCSFHRSKRGWAPTGTLYRHAIAEGYKSVAHFLVLNNLTDEAKPVALERGMCPPELAAELRKEIAEVEKAGTAAQEAQPAPAPEAAPASEGEADAAVQGVPQPAAAVQEQLLQPEQAAEEEAPAAAAPAAAGGRRSARGAAAKGTAAEAAGGRVSPKPSPKKRQVTLTLAGVRKSKAGSGSAAGGKQLKAGAAAAAGKGTGKTGDEVPAPERRGLRSSARLRTATA